MFHLDFYFCQVNLKDVDQYQYKYKNQAVNRRNSTELQEDNVRLVKKIRELESEDRAEKDQEKS
jgi:pyruvate formate-lyase activating enzyme-like uncharacterized protein